MPNQQSVRVRYEDSEVTYASQFISNATQEEIVINCSPGYMSDPTGQEIILPVQQRIAVTPEGAKRLIKVLEQALESSVPAKPKPKRKRAKAKATTSVGTK